MASPQRRITRQAFELEDLTLRRAIARNRGSTPEQKQLWRDGIYEQIREVMPMQGSLSIERMCRLSGVSRAGFYRCLQEQMPGEEDMEVRSAIQQIAFEHRRRHGYRKDCGGTATVRDAGEPRACRLHHAGG